MEINFKELMMENIEGNELAFDARTLVGNVLFNLADDVAEHDLGIKIYHSEGTIDLNEKEVKIVEKYLSRFKYLLRNSIEKKLKS